MTAMHKTGWRETQRFSALTPRAMTVITDPLFYAVAVPAVIFLGLSKGGFSGIGMVSTPLLAIIMPPLEAAAILLPIILVQDVVSVWVYRRVWDPWNLKVMIPGCVVGVGAAWLLAAYVSRRRDPAGGRADRARLRRLCIFPSHAAGRAAAAARMARRVLGRAVGLHHDAHPDRRPALLRFRAAAAAGEDDLRRHHGDVLRRRQCDEGRALFRARPVLHAGLATSFALFPLAIACNFLGIYLVRVTPEAMFYRITNVIVFLLGLELTRQGVTELLR